ncbi:hypothetical protein KJ980_06270 [Patescibacteria group bacterium]|nr:hypothetical protein [Patescibacteria group bacterium]MBU4017292.1 hypothetical protein [Patescibacteria group bacterium]MBU4099224.1 hypothetical protein [Patescibacteria group bacterium]
MEITHEISPQQSLESKINKSAPENPILNKLRLIDKQEREQKSLDVLPELSNQRINLYAELQQMTNQNLSKKEALTKAMETELKNLQEKLTRMTELDNLLFKDKSPNNNVAGFKENIKITKKQIKKIQQQLPPGLITAPDQSNKLLTHSQIMGFKK